MSVSNIEERMENAYSTLLANVSSLSAYPRYLGFGTDVIAQPNIQIVISNSKPEVAGCQIMTGNWNLNVEITVESNTKDTTRSTHEQIFATVKDAILTDDLVTNLNATGQNLGVMLVTPTGVNRSVSSDHARKSTLTLETFSMTTSG